MASDVITLPDNCPPLTSYYVYLTKGCNLACQHCWIAPTYQASGGTGGHLSLDQLIAVVEEGIPLGLGHVKLTGGEPTLHPDFVEFVAYLKDRGLPINIETNGTLMTKELARVVAQATRTVSVSLDGARAETHDALRGVKGSFEAATRGFRNLVEAGIHPQVIMSIHTGNVDEVEDLVMLAQSLEANSVKFNLIQPAGRGKLMAQRERVLNIDGLLELGNWIEQDLQSRVNLPLIYSWPIAFWGLRRLNSNIGYSCSMQNILGILPTGHMALCGIGTSVPDMCFGELGVDRLVDVWTSHPTLLAIREKLPGQLEGICSECVFRDYCKGVCIAENYVTGGRVTAPAWFCTMADEKGLFPASRRLNVSVQQQATI